LRDEEWESLIKEFDKNDDGMINFEEFKLMMNSLHCREGIKKV
jgi:Ca2+-binding EF-hand superfamily protein